MSTASVISSTQTAVGSGSRVGFFSNPVTYLGALVLLIVAMGFDVMQSQSRYLYFTTLVMLILGIASIYVAAFRGMRWSDPFEPGDAVPQKEWKRNAALLSGVYFGLIAVLGATWFLRARIEGVHGKAMLHMGLAFLYFASITFAFYLLVRRRDKYIHLQALAVSTLILVPILTGYEAIMLAWGHAWEYNHTVIAWVMGVPLENVIFLYPVTPALTMIIFSLVTRRLNDLKAFWVTMAILAPAAVMVEWVAIYPLDIWRIFNDYSVLPIGKANLEEYLFYVVFLAFSLVLYVYFRRNLQNGG